MPRVHQVCVEPLPHWLDRRRFLGAAEWQESSTPLGIKATARLDTSQAADILARLRNLGLNGHSLVVDIQPPLKRTAVRAARTDDARRRRDTTPGFEHPNAKSHPDGRIGLTPESLATEMAQGTSKRTVFDACCGIGGNAIGFAKAGATVHAVERRTDLLHIAKHNARIYQVSQHITFQCGDTLAHTPEDIDICFVDPPWGTDWDRIRCELSDFPLAQSLWNHFRQNERWREFWLKVPSSFVPSSLHRSARTTPIFGQATGDRQRIKCLLVKGTRDDL